MTKLEDAVRDTIQGLASEAQGADLGQRALSGARRRSVRVLGARVLAVLVVVAMAVGLAVFIDGRRIDVPPAGSVVWPLPKPLDAKSTGSVLTYYFDNNGSKILDPKTGKYRELSGRVVDFSPDLRYVVLAFDRSGSDESSEYAIFDATTGEKVNVLAYVPKDTNLDILWSPDGRWLAILESVSHWRSTEPIERQSYSLRFLDLRTGDSKEVSFPEIPRGALLGWLPDSTAVVAMNSSGREHYLVGRDGSQSTAVSWPTGFLPGWKMVPRTSLMVLGKGGDDRGNAEAAIVMDVRTGQIVDEFVPMPLPVDLQYYQLEWLTVNERLVSASNGLSVFNVRTGAIKHIRTMDQNYGVTARPASGLSRAAQRLVF